MKNEEFEQIKRNIEKFAEEVEEMKASNPEENYDELEKKIELLRQMIDEKNVKKIERGIICRRLLSLFLGLIYHFIITFCVFGFLIPFVNKNMHQYIGLIVFVVGFVSFVLRKLIKGLVFGGPLKKHPIFYFISMYFIITAIMGIIDYLFIGIWTSIWYSILTLCVIGAVLDFGEWLYYRKIVIKYRNRRR